METVRRRQGRTGAGKLAVRLTGIIIGTAALLAAAAGCTPEQRAKCAVCRLVSGQWTCEKPAATRPADPNEVQRWPTKK